jgi:hypothetical protein
MSDREQMFAPVDDFDGGELLRDWRWLVPQPTRIVRVTAFGDVFYADAADALWFLDSHFGKASTVAERSGNLAAFLSNKSNRRRFLWSFAVRLLLAEGRVLGQNQCYSPKQPVYLGGSMDSKDVEIIDVRVHLGIMGQLHEQTTGKNAQADRMS